MKWKRTVLVLSLAVIFSFVDYTFHSKNNSYAEPSAYFNEQLAKAKAGDAVAQMKIGTYYRWGMGMGVQIDLDESIKWYRKAAEQGEINAQFDLACMYDNGEGVPQDYFEAVKWYQMAADEKWLFPHPDAQNNLGTHYAKGEGVPRDYKKALLFYQKAAERGRGRAQCNLGAAYELGQGTLVDYVKAYAWWNVAKVSSVSSFDHDPDAQETATENLIQIERKMTSEQIAEAQKLSNIIWERISNNINKTPSKK